MDWIAVKDTLPSDDNGRSLYIVYVKVMFGVGIGVANYIDGEFTNVILSGDAQWDTHRVTHWMPMPDRPKEDK